MAITNAQQYKQLLAKGGRIGLKGGADASMADFGTVTTPGVSAGRKGPGPNVNAGEASFNDLGPAPSRKSRERNQKAFNTGVGITDLERLKDEGVPKLNAPGFLSAGLNFAKPLRDIVLRKNINYFKENFSGPYTLDNYKEFMKNRLDQFTPDNDNDNNQIFIPQDMMAEAPSIMDQETEVEEEPFEISRRFRAEGGIMNTDVVGGEMDFDSARQMYGLGKLVKKITRSVKKVAKSPIGKAALLGLGGYYLGGGQFGSLMKGASKFGFIPQMTYGNAAGSGFGFSNILPNVLNIAKMPGLAEKASSIGSVGNVLTGITAASAIAGMLTPQQEEEAQMISDQTGIDIETIRANPNEYLGRRFRAEGGSMDEPVAKKTMPLLDMDGQEMDLRAEGGFVPIGRMEKADDVPARLSKNEFVFTADAVRNAGEGDVDKGAEVMYNMMKNLESGGEVSEESQGLDGAREMFQTSKRLEEVL